MEDAKQRFEEAAQELSDYLKENEKTSIDAKFPWGFIRPLKEHYPRWPYLSSERKRTVACVIQLCDINRWNLNVWDIDLTAGTMWEWNCALSVMAVIETLIYEFGLQFKLFPSNTKFKKAINVFNSKGVINQNLRDKLHEFREFRNEIHLYLKNKVEMYDGKPKKYNQSVLALRNLEKALIKYWKVNK